MPSIRKKIRHLDKQDPNESRRLWNDVTIALKNGDVEAATDAKHIVSNGPQYTVELFTADTIGTSPHSSPDLWGVLDYNSRVALYTIGTQESVHI